MSKVPVVLLLLILSASVVPASVAVRQGMAIRTQKLKVFEPVVLVVAVYMMQFQWNRSALP